MIAGWPRSGRSAHGLTGLAKQYRVVKEALHNLSRVAFESSQTVRQGVQAQRLPDWQVKPGNAAAASVRPNR